MQFLAGDNSKFTRVMVFSAIAGAMVPYVQPIIDALNLDALEIVDVPEGGLALAVSLGLLELVYRNLRKRSAFFAKWDPWYDEPAA